LFRAFLRASGQNDENRFQLRKDCVAHVTKIWSRFSTQANQIHREAPYFRSRSPNRPTFPSPDCYREYMLLEGTAWGSDLEALAAAEIHKRSVLIWSQSTRQNGFLMNHNEGTATTGAVHILHSGNHFDALIPEAPEANCIKTKALAQKIATDNVIHVMDQPSIQWGPHFPHEKRQKLVHGYQTHASRPESAPSEASTVQNVNAPIDLEGAQVATNSQQKIHLGKRRLPPSMIAIAQRHEAKRQRKLSKAYRQVMPHKTPRSEYRYGTSAVNTKRKR
jgi:hypothetical protein